MIDRAILDHVPRVLIVDDERHNRALLEVMLAPEGYCLLIAASGAEALALVAQQAPDLILLDLMMADMDGYEVAARIKGNIATKNVPIIMVTVRDDREAKMRGLQAGAEEFLSKPVDRAELCVRVRNLLRLKAYGDYHARYERLLEQEIGARTAELLEAELRFRRLFESGIIGVTVTEGAGAVVEANATFLDLLGYSRADLDAGRLSWLTLTPSDWHGNHATVRADLAEQGHATAWEKEYLRKDGTRVPVLVGVAALDAKRNITVVTDLTERKRAERSVLERMQVSALSGDVGLALTQGETLRDMLQRCAQAIVTNLGAAMVRIWTSSGTSGVLDLQASAGLETEVDGATARRSARKFDLDRISRERVPHVSHDLQNDAFVIDPAWALRQGMHCFAGYPLIVDGELVGVMGIFAQATMSDVALKGLAATVDTIAVRIRGKVAELANKGLEEQLRQSQKMEAVGRLAGGVAHDFNNLLSVVLSYAELAIDDLPAGDPTRGDIEEIHRAGVRAADLTRQLLMFSRQQVVAPKVLDLNDVLSSMNKMLRRIVGEDVQLTTVPGASLGRVCVDPGSIEQVIMNLVINARDAMPTGGKIIMETANVVLDEQFVSQHLGAKTGPYVMVSVSDSGTGMDRATLARIFEPFFTTKAQGKGTGLGLSTVFGIAQQSGGTVWVYSEPGIGTTFKVYLPQVDAVADVARPPRDLLPGRGTETVLLVEDEDQVRDVARGILRRYGYTVLEARNAGEALLLCEKHVGTIDLLLSDVVMPGMSGPELAKRLAQGHPTMKVLCMSGYTDDAAVRHGVIDAHFAYLQKPLTVDALTRKVRDVLDAVA